MHSFVTSKNVKWCHLIWPTLYMVYTMYIVCASYKKYDILVSQHSQV